MPSSKHCILIVEDDDDIRETLREILQGEGFSITEAVNGLEAIRYLQNAASLPSLILLDVMMPVMNGLQFRAEQLKNPLWRELPVVMVSASTREKLGESVAGMDYLQKPLKLDQLLAAIASHLGPEARLPAR